MTHKDFALKIAKEAGDVIRANFGIGMKKEWKSDHTPLTLTDTTINQMVIEAVNKNFPGHSILGEEDSSLIEGSEYVWVCDPIDGTIPFSHGIPTCVFSLALVQNGKPILGVVYDPFMDRMFFAELGKGAFLNGERIYVANIKSFSNTVGYIGFWKGPLLGAFLNIQKEFMNLEVKMVNVCSVIYEATLLAAGEISVAIFPGTAPHDAATVKIIVEEAGGVVTDLYGNEQRYDQPIKGFVATTKLLHPQVLEIIKKSFK